MNIFITCQYNKSKFLCPVIVTFQTAKLQLTIQKQKDNPSESVEDEITDLKQG